MQQQVICARVVVLGAFAPVVRDGVGEDRAIAIERADRDRLVALVESLQALP